jgi:uncharacterized protein
MKTAALLFFTAVAAHAANFFVNLEVTPAVDFARLTPAQMAIFQQHGANLQKLRDAGVLVTAGRILKDPAHAHAIAIFTAENETAAREILAADPAVKAGLMKAIVEPLDLVFPPVAAK